MTLNTEEKLKEKYLQNLPEKLLNLNGLIAEDDRVAVQSILHKLAGSAGMYGFPLISEIAAEIEGLIIAGKPLDSVSIKALLKQLYANVDQIKREK